jgi:RNA polymerase sigma-70 factor (ECF subfamily)
VLDASDASLVRRAQGGDVNAVGELYDRHHAHIFRYVWSRVHDGRSAEDLTGEVFTRMVTSLADYRPMGVPFRAWLYRIAHNLVVDHYRKESDHALVPLYHAEGLSGEENSPALIVEHRLTAERVQRALAKLDPSQREVVVLRFLVGLSLREVALTLGKTVAAVKSLQHRGLAALRVALKQE